jgi:hypothetical protein
MVMFTILTMIILGIHRCYNRRKRRIEKLDNNDIKMKLHESETKTVPNTQNIV